VTSPLSRRDFLRLAGLLSGSAVFPPFLQALPPAQQAAAGKKNVLIVVFDAFSAYNISLYGYGRETTPNIDRLAERAIVYHNHFAACNWTAPSTASLMTGVLPWTHRAMSFNQPVEESLVRKNIFGALSDYYRIVYSHHPWVNAFFRQFRSSLDEFLPIGKLYLTWDPLAGTLFPNDRDTARLSSGRIAKKLLNGGYAYSLLLSEAYDRWLASRTAALVEAFPRGLPNMEGDSFFVLEQAIDFLGDQLMQIPQPFLAYFHFLPPHWPYNTTREFVDRFRDDHLKIARKPPGVFTTPSAYYFRNRRSMRSRITDDVLNTARQQYDEYILYADREFNRFFEHLEDSGLLEDTWLILTSDHGELFERGMLGHAQPAMFQPEIRIPLLIYEPGRTQRMDVRTPTSTIDLLPTLLQITGGTPADWSEGGVLPPFTRTSVDPNRSIFATSTLIRPWENQPPAPLKRATHMLVKGRYKLTYFFGYQELEQGTERVDLYDIEADPEELNNLNTTHTDIARALLDELKTKLAVADKPYR